MHTLKNKIWVVLSSGCLLLASCGDDGGKTADAGVIDSAPDDAEGCVCDPVGAFPMQGTLLNATLTNDVQVIVREVRHPGCAGPTDLP
jgi:hypothetical protein